MKWINHKVATFSVVYFITHDVISSVFAMVGSIFPDAIEGHNYASERWKRNHRRLSHWFLGYFIVASILWFMVKAKTGISIETVSFSQFLSVFKVINSETLIYFMFYIGFFLLFWLYFTYS
ncbi:hypothetical protein [Thermodesulfovibrio sp. TK110]